MSSEDSDDEPLSVLATRKAKKPWSCKEEESSEGEASTTDSEVDGGRSKKRGSRKRKYDIVKSLLAPPVVIERPMDVWLYLRDLTLTGPYSCLLCPEWFINKTKIVIHYILNHKKDFCGICRYFVPDQEHWITHQQFHIPWVCSQCSETFSSEPDLRVHFSLVHNLVHCRMCSFVIVDNEEYDQHLFKKHHIVKITNKDVAFPWEIEYEGSLHFICQFCSKRVENEDFFRHFMCYHRYNLKCFSMLLSGSEVPFTIHGANISADFLNTHFQDQSRAGYVDLQPKKEVDQKANMDDNSNNFMAALIPEIKQELVANDFVEKNLKSIVEENYVSHCVPLAKVEPKIEAPKEEIMKVEDIMAYKGEEYFDFSSLEVIVLQDMCRIYIDQVMNEITTETLQGKMELDYSLVRNQIEQPLECPICDQQSMNIGQFVSHLTKLHLITCVPVFSCRICLARFDTETEYKKHIAAEMKDFEDLWLCQYCDREFTNREDTREHLKVHLERITVDNCFSLHLGFKCRFCSYLFWNETDREEHTRKVHTGKWLEEYYKCYICGSFYSDKVFFLYHFMETHMTHESNIMYLLKCMICSITAPKIENMRDHFNREHPTVKKTYCCLPPCKFKPMGLPKAFKIHKRLVHTRGMNAKGSGKNNLTCSVCGREFETAKSCGVHMSLAHGPGRFKCKLCPDALQSVDERKLHYLLKHPGEYHFECKICLKTFQYKSTLYMHRASVHLINQPTFTCSYCNKVFHKKDSYREHLQIHEGPRHTCSYCPMRFVQRSNMLRHERRHTGERPYTCPICPRTFSDKGACNSHSKTHNRTARNECNVCGQTFAQKSKLNYHIRKHTGEGLESCQVCSKLFTSTYYLREHMKIHDGKAGSPCPICKRHFNHRSNLIKHVRNMHSNTGSQTCPICNKQLTTMTGLRKHLVTHSTIKPYNCLKCPKTYSVKKSVLKHLRKRHNIRSNSENHFKELEPQVCDLGIDQDILNEIFSKSKLPNAKAILDSYVKFPEVEVIVKKEIVDDTDDDNDRDNNEGDGDNDYEDDGDNDDADDENDNDSRVNNDDSRTNPESSNTCNDDESRSLEPTNFVSIKIEPMDDQCEYDTED